MREAAQAPIGRRVAGCPWSCGCLRLWKFDNDVVGSNQAQLVASYGFNLVGIGLQRFYFAGKFGVFIIQAGDFVLDALNFQFGAAHRQKAMRAEYIVKKKGEHAQNHHCAPVLRPENREFRFLRHEIGQSEL